MKHIIIAIILTCCFNNLFAQPSFLTFKDINSRLSTKYFYDNLDYIQRRFDSEKYEGVILRAKDLLVTHYNFDSAGLNPLYNLLITSFCRLEYYNEIETYRNKAIQYGVNVDSIINNCFTNSIIVSDSHKRAEKKNPVALDLGIGYKFGTHFDSEYLLPNYSINTNLRKYFYLSPKAKLFVNFGFRYTSEQYPLISRNGNFVIVDGKLQTQTVDIASLKLGFGFDVLLFKKANISMAPTLNFCFGSHFYEYFLMEFYEQLTFDFEKKMHVKNTKIGLGLSLGFVADSEKFMYMGVFGRVFF